MILTIDPSFLGIFWDIQVQRPTVDGSEIPRSPVEVGSSSQYLHGFLHWTGGWPCDFWTINSNFGKSLGCEFPQDGKKPSVPGSILMKHFLWDESSRMWNNSRPGGYDETSSSASLGGSRKRNTFTYHDGILGGAYSVPWKKRLRLENRINTHYGSMGLVLFTYIFPYFTIKNNQM